MKLYKRKRSPFWYADLRAWGLGKRSTGESDFEAAKKKAQAFVRIARPQKIPKSGPITLGKMLDLYLPATSHKSKVTQSVERWILGILKAEIGEDCLLSEIRPEAIDRFKSRIFSMKGKDGVTAAKASSITKYLSAARTFFSKAVEWKYIDESPMRRIKSPRLPKRLPRYFAPEEIKQLFEKAPPYWREVFLIYLYTGMRRAELTNLKWSDVRGGMIIVKDPKEGREKIIPIAPPVQMALDRLPRDSERVVKWSPSWVWENFKRTAEAAGLHESKLHRLRHSFATYLLDATGDLKGVSELMGHSTVQTTEIYLDILGKKKRATIEKLDFSSIVPPGSLEE